MKKIVVAVSGASGTLLARALLLALGAAGAETHLIISSGAMEVMAREEGVAPVELRSLAVHAHDADALGAPMASGSWRHDGMVVCPCSMATLGAVARGCGTNLVHRAADVALKERRRLVLVVRETPLSAVHLENMLAASRAGAVIMPPCPAYYAGLRTLEEAGAHFAGRILDQLDLPPPNLTRWQG